jgi:hypothetical protein
VGRAWCNAAPLLLRREESEALACQQILQSGECLLISFNT